MVTADQIERDGYAVVEGVIPPDFVGELIDACGAVALTDGAGRRNLLAEVPAARRLALSPQIRSLVTPQLGGAAFVARAILFDKTPAANWAVPWHQDTTIAVRKRRDVDGFGPWSVKAGVVHVQPPAAVLEGMLTVRLHLDGCGPKNGPLAVLPGSHRDGILCDEAVDRWKARHDPVVCRVGAGGAVLMRPLVLHASPRAASPAHRRVIHLEFAAADLPGGLEWARA